MKNSFQLEYVHSTRKLSEMSCIPRGFPNNTRRGSSKDVKTDWLCESPSATRAEPNSALRSAISGTDSNWLTVA